jgi:hypothetical protein
MKKLLFSVSVTMIVMVTQTVCAQINIGPKAGFNYNSFHKNLGVKNFQDAIPGFHAGVFGKYSVLEFLSVRAELIYNLQGSGVEDYRALSDLYRKDVKLAFHNAALPIIVELGLPGMAEAKVQPKLLLGGYYSYLFYARESYSNVAQLSGSPSVVFEGFTNVTDQFNQHQFGAIAGIGADVLIFSRPVSLDLRYQYNVNPVNKNGTEFSYNLSGVHAEWGNDLFVHTLSFSAGVSLFKL